MNITIIHVKNLYIVYNNTYINLHIFILFRGSGVYFEYKQNFNIKNELQKSNIKVRYRYLTFLTFLRNIVII